MAAYQSITQQQYQASNNSPQQCLQQQNRGGRLLGERIVYQMGDTQRLTLVETKVYVYY